MSGLLWMAKKQCTDSICKLEEEEGEGGKRARDTGGDDMNMV